MVPVCGSFCQLETCSTSINADWKSVHSSRCTIAGCFRAAPRKFIPSMVTAIRFFLCLAPVVLNVAQRPAHAHQDPAPPAITDKTFVVWAELAHLDQGGASPLSLIDRAERFDAVVFAECQPGTWMAGSDFFRRTSQQQANWPREVAAPGEVIQLAIIYQGNHVTILRNGQKITDYEISQPQPFGDDAMVLLGLRYVGEMGEIGFLTGSVDDARIYDRALTVAQIAALKPNEPSEPVPVAWWDFEQDRFSDRLNRFPISRLMGSARIADGKLHLDGRGYLWAARSEQAFAQDLDDLDDQFDRAPQTLFYQARSRRTGEMWDTWLYIDQGTWYLFYLAKAGANWDNISLATSTDGVHWREHGRLLYKARGVTWMGTGSTWQSPHFAADRKFFLNFSQWRGPRQTIFFAESTDLLNWTKLGDEFEFVQDERWYERDGRWDCIWTIPRPDGHGLYGYWTATPKRETGGCFGFGQSTDGFQWQALPPPKVVGIESGEVGAIAQRAGRYYMLFGHFPTMQTLVADRPEGPFAVASKNLTLLDRHTYFCRFLAVDDELLVNHHSMSRSDGIYFAPLKSALIDAEGTLRLAWWSGNDRAKQREIGVNVKSDGNAAVTLLDNYFNVSQNLILEGTLDFQNARSDSSGLFVECADGSGIAIAMHASGQAEVGPFDRSTGNFQPDKRIDRQRTFGPTATFRLLVHQSLIEVYLDDLLIDCYSLPGTASGRIGLWGDRSAFGQLRAWGSSLD